MSSSDYAHTSISQPPPGVTPNFDHPQSRAFQAYIGMGVCIVFTAVLLALRIYIKLAMITHMWGWDDWTCLTGFMFMIAYNAILFSLMKPGGWLGIHTWDTKLTSYTKGYLQLTLAASNLYAASALFVKVSLFLLYLRLFRPNKITRRLCYAGISTCVLLYCASIVSNCALCIPRAGHQSDTLTWSLSFERCARPSVYLALCQGAFGTLIDIYLLVIPIHAVFQLHLPVKRKVGVSVIFLVGIIAIMSSIGCVGYRAKWLSGSDISWDSIPPYIFSTAELSAGVVCSCMPIFPALFRGRTPKKYRFSFLRYFSLHSSSRPYLLNDTQSLNDIHSSKRHVFSEYGTHGGLSLDDGIVVVKPKQAVTKGAKS